MKKITTITALALVLAFSGNAMAQFSPANGTPNHAAGYVGPSAALTTVKQAKEMRDDTPVILEGKIEKSLGGEKYTFTDSTGSITVEIDNDDWNGVTVNENDIVLIKGEVDKDFTKVEIDVDSISLKK